MTESAYGTDVAFRLSGSTDVPSVKYEMVMGIFEETGRDAACQNIAHKVRSICMAKSYTVSNPEYMSIHRNGIHAESHIHHHSGSFDSDTGKRRKFRLGHRNFSSEIGNKLPCQPRKITGLSPVKSNRGYYAFYLFYGTF